MNIFILDLDPAKCAAYHCDKHVVKMVTETAQILSTATKLKYKEFYKEDIIADELYNITHPNHPPTKWAMESVANFQWLLNLGKSLEGEYSRRYKKIHASAKVIWLCEAVSNLFPRKSMTPFPQCMPDQYKDPIDAVKAYRNYYKGEKAYFARWQYTEPPKWFF